MKKILKRGLALLLCLVLLASMAACGESQKPDAPAATEKVNPEALLYALLERVKYDTELTNKADLAAIYFPDMPEGTDLFLYQGSGYFADEVVLITLKSADDADAVKKVLKNHLAQMTDQFRNYQDAELSKIEKAIIWQQDTTVILVVTNDAETAQQILDNPADPSYTVPGTTAPADPSDPSTSPSADPSVTDPSTSPTEPSVEQTDPSTNPSDPTDPVDPPAPEYQVPADTLDTSLDLSYVHYYSDKVTIRVGNRAFENHVYIERSAKNYVALINQAVEKFGEDVTVYQILIPTAIGVVLPEEAIPNYPDYIDQKETIQTVFDMVDDSVVKVDCIDNLRAHKDEYLYFRTDYHWNGPAAYYAYESFCQAKGITPYTLAQREEYVFDGFLGGLYQGAAGKDSVIGEIADTVYAYGPKCDVSMEITDSSGKTFSWPVIVNVNGWAANSKYNCFAGSDNPLTVFTNADLNDGSACIVIKESFGNAMMSYIADHYQTVYEIDYRHWDGDIYEFAKEHGVTDVIFANNMSMLRNDLLIGMLSEIL